MDELVKPSFESVTPNLSVLDLPRALEYYERVLGFSRAWTWGEPMELASVCRGRIELNLSLRGKSGPPGPGRAYVRVSQIDAVWKEITARGATVTAQIADRPYGMRDFGICDESGNLIDFGEPMPEERHEARDTPGASTLKVFVPTKDFALAKRFYAALGFEQTWEGGELAEVELAGCKLLLQNRYQKDWADHFVVHVEVPDADAWARHAARVIAGGTFPGARLEGPKVESWGYKVTYVIDPSGVCLHFAQPLARPGGA